MTHNVYHIGILLIFALEISEGAGGVYRYPSSPANPRND